MNYTIKNTIHNEAQDQMKNIINSLPELEEKDIVTLDLLSDALDTFYKAIDGINQSGLVITNQQGNTVASPYVKIKNDAQIVIFKITKQYGCNLMDRKKLEKDIPEEDDSPLNEFLKG